MMPRLGLLLVLVFGFAVRANAAQTDDPPAGAAAPTGQSAPGRSDDVPQALRQAVMDKMARGFVLPDSVVWKFDFTQPYPTGGTSVCGRVNYQNSTRRYVGEQPFFARLLSGRVIKAGIISPSKIEDPVHAVADAFAVACGGK